MRIYEDMVRKYVLEVVSRDQVINVGCVWEQSFWEIDTKATHYIHRLIVQIATVVQITIPTIEV
jgi:hypothetical protein